MDERAVNYSVLSAITGSFFAATLAGISPEISVSTTLTVTMTSAATGESAASPAIPVSTFIIRLINMESTYVTTTPNNPADSPIINVCPASERPANAARRFP